MIGKENKKIKALIKNDFSKTWITLYLIIVVLFSIIGFVMILFDNLYFNGIRYLVTSIVFGTAIFLIKRNKVKPNYSNPKMFLGFIFSVIGLTSTVGSGMNLGMWALGGILFLSGLFDKNDK